jgi:putative flippase GtrA
MSDGSHAGRGAAVVGGAVMLQTPTSVERTKPRRRTIFVFSQHQISAAVATAVDFAIMIACKSGLGMTPAMATAVGSLFGAVVSFTLGRHWVFQQAHSDIRGQALRYAFASTLSLIFNSLGEKLFVAMGLNYVLARVLLSVVVGMLWNFPMHRYFVFRDRAPRPVEKAPDAAVSAAAQPQTARHHTS